MDSLRALFLVPRVDKASTRYRVLQFFPFLEREGFDVSVKELSRTSREWSALVRRIGGSDVVFIQKKLFTPWELFLIRKLSRRLIYDFDDAVMTKDGPANSFKEARQRRRFEATVRAADLVIAGNGYLRRQALPLKSDVVQLPTVIDTDRYSEKRFDPDKEEVVIGWIGSRGTLKYLREITPALERLGESFPHLKLKIVADDFLHLSHLEVIRKRWSEQDEIDDLHSFDIGLMPLTDDPWTRGKCGFKLLQCMAVGMPVVCSPVGVNAEIVTDGREGYWATTEREWEERLRALITKSELRRSMGLHARAKVVEKYSLAVNAPLFCRMLRGDYEESSGA